MNPQPPIPRKEMGRINHRKVYIRNLPTTVTKLKLMKLFEKFGDVTNVTIFGQNFNFRGCGYIEFAAKDGARKAIRKMDKKKIEGNIISLEYFREKPDIREKQPTTVFVFEISPDENEDDFIKRFESFGTIKRNPQFYEDENSSSGLLYCEVEFDDPEAARKCAESGFDEKVRRTELVPQEDRPQFTQNNDTALIVRAQMQQQQQQQFLYRRQQQQQFQMSQLQPYFRGGFQPNQRDFFGGTTYFDENGNAVKVPDQRYFRQQGVPYGGNQRFGYSPDMLFSQNMRGRRTPMYTQHDEHQRRYYTHKRHTPTTMQEQLKKERQEKLKRVETSKYYNNCNLFVFHLPQEVDDGKLRELFENYGEVKSVKVIRSPQGSSKGYGFVMFFNHGDAQEAVRRMDGAKVGTKFLKVSFKTNRYEQRRRRYGDRGGERDNRDRGYQRDRMDRDKEPDQDFGQSKP